MSLNRKKSILVVDDEAGIREMLRFDLEEIGFLVEEAPDGSQAWMKFCDFDFDFVLTDLRMPGVDGLELLKKIRVEGGKQAKVILMTAHSVVAHEEALKEGAAAVLTKPFSIEQLKAILEILDQSDQGAQARRSLRIPVKVKGKVSFSPIGETKVVFENLSKTGFFAYTHDPIPAPDTNITFEMQLGYPNETTITGEGVVRWVRIGDYPVSTSGFGVQLTKVKEDVFELLGDFLYKFDPEKFSP